MQVQLHAHLGAVAALKVQLAGHWQLLLPPAVSPHHCC
jgi:hypothetical protein